MAAFSAAGFLYCWGGSFGTQEAPGFWPCVGWAVLGAGLAVAVSRGGWWAAAIPLALAALTLWSMVDAYHRDGGWPGVAGWEFNGMESPIVLSTAVVTVVLIAAPVGFVLGLARRVTAITWSTRHPVNTATAL
jgi:hypothetical protein